MEIANSLIEKGVGCDTLKKSWMGAIRRVEEKNMRVAVE